MQCLFYAWVSGELSRAAVQKGPGLEGWSPSRQSAMVLLLNGMIAFSLSIVSLTANQKNGRLATTVARKFPRHSAPPQEKIGAYVFYSMANVKQVLTILLAMYMSHMTITPANPIGIGLMLAGGVWYGALGYREGNN